MLVAELDGAVVGTCYLNIIANLTRAARPYALVLVGISIYQSITLASAGR